MKAIIFLAILSAGCADKIKLPEPKTQAVPAQAAPVAVPTAKVPTPATMPVSIDSSEDSPLLLNEDEAVQFLYFMAHTARTEIMVLYSSKGYSPVSGNTHEKILKVFFALFGQAYLGRTFTQKAAIARCVRAKFKSCDPEALKVVEIIKKDMKGRMLALEEEVPRWWAD